MGHPAQPGRGGDLPSLSREPMSGSRRGESPAFDEYNGYALSSFAFIGPVLTATGAVAAGANPNIGVALGGIMRPAHSTR